MAGDAHHDRLAERCAFPDQHVLGCTIRPAQQDRQVVTPKVAQQRVALGFPRSQARSAPVNAGVEFVARLLRLRNPEFRSTLIIDLVHGTMRQ